MRSAFTQLFRFARHFSIQRNITYDIRVQTGNHRGAGAHAHVKLRLYGKRGVAESLLPPFHFQRGSDNVFSLELDEVGCLEKLNLTNGDIGHGTDWYLSKVFVKNAATGKEWEFPCDRWIDSKNGIVSIDLFPLTIGPDIKDANVATNALLAVGSSMFPYPGKANGGEDAFFVSTLENGSIAMGVADGVGDWTKKGVDAGFFSRLLMRNCSEIFESSHVYDPMEMLRIAWNQMLDPATAKPTLHGSCTACIMTFDSNSGLIRVANLGDSGMMLIRNGKLQLWTPPQEHFPGYPYQLSSQKGCRPEDAQQFQLTAEIGDIVIMGSDGLFDNIHANNLIQRVWELRHLHTPSVARHIAEMTFETSLDKKADTPYARECAKEFSQLSLGGKMDDITVILAKVLARKKENKIK